MTPFSLLVGLAGLSHREASTFLNVSMDSIRGWVGGRRSPSPRILDRLRGLIADQERAATGALALISEKAAAAEAQGDHLADIEIGYPADDYEAQALGLPCVGAWEAMAARVVARSPVHVTLVPRGSTVGTAAAADAHNR